jgi:glutathione S-transferase
MAAPVRIVGSFLSPYVRKVLVALEIKGIPYEVDPIVPFYGDDEFTRLSPLRRVPVLVDDAVTLCDSTVICEYLEERHPTPPLLPKAPAARARSRWFEEFADTRMGDVLIWRYYAQFTVRRILHGLPPDEAVVAKARDVEIPAILDYLERELPADGFLCGEPSLGDVAVASMFRNAMLVRYEIDAARWPTSRAFVDRVLALPAFVRLRRYEEAMLGAPAAERRPRLQAAGAPLTATTVMGAQPRAGVMATGLMTD